MCLSHQENHFSPHFCIPRVLNEVVLLLIKVNTYIISSKQFVCSGHGLSRCSHILSCREKTRPPASKAHRYRRLPTKHSNQIRSDGVLSEMYAHSCLCIKSPLSYTLWDPSCTTKQVSPLAAASGHTDISPTSGGDPRSEPSAVLENSKWLFVQDQYL